MSSTTAPPYHDPLLDDFATDEPIITDETAAATATPAADSNDSSSEISSIEEHEDIFEDMMTLPNLRSQPQYIAAMTEVQQTSPTDHNNSSFNQEQSRVERLNAILAKMDDSIVLHHRRAVLAYKSIFPELETLVPDPIDFCRVLVAYGQNDDAPQLANILSAAQCLVVKVSKTNCKTTVRGADRVKLNEALHCSNEVLALHQDRIAILRFLETHMHRYAPNLCAVVGPRCASLVLGLAGGLEKLSLLPSNLIQNIGRKAKATDGIITGVPKAMQHAGVIAVECPLVSQTPPHLRKRALRTVSGKLTLAARIDFSKRDPQGKLGHEWYEEIAAKIQSWKDPGPGKVKKALPVPDAEKPKRRGGGRARREKQQRGLTQMRAMSNRIAMTGSTEEYSLAAMGESTGMLGTSAAAGRVRAVQARDTQRLAAKANKKLKSISTLANGSRTSGFTSLAFTPVQGIELRAGGGNGGAGNVNPAATPQHARSSTSSSLPPVPLFQDMNNNKKA